ncbi:MAG: CRISPR-associated endonuclease Cas1 [Candidatus Aenigmatarchaeota archaeon]
MRKIYAIGNGKIVVKEKCLVFEKFKSGKKISNKIPIENLDLIICIGNIGLSPNSIKSILRKEIKVIFLNSEGFLKGILLPIGKAFSSIYVNQCHYFLEKRLEIARSIVNGLKISAIKTLELIKTDTLIEGAIEELKEIEIDGNIQEIMGFESQIWKVIYDVIRIKYDNEFKREYNPPKDEINCLISYGNSILYSIILLKIIEEGLNPKIGFLHKNEESRYSLVLDMSEIFKPFVVLLLNLSLLKNNLLNQSHFDNRDGTTLLNLVGRSIYLKYFENFLQEKMNIFPCKRKNLESFISFEIKKLRECIVSFKEYVPWA